LPKLFNPFVVTGWLRWFYPRYLWRGKPGNRNVYLTFDDGPHPEITLWVLDLLEQHEAKATFFILGKNASLFPNLCEHISSKGHTLANHTQNHKKGWQSKLDEYLQDVEECNNIVNSKLFRPPYGRIKRKQGRKLIEKGYEIVMWSLLSRDYDKQLNCRKSLNILKKNTRPGSIVVFHDSEKAAPQLKIILPEYLLFLKEQNYNFAAL
jgi:peptidoglycan/xylan/chitin deacetylase (PgdA/CDA1 family)